MRIRFQPVLVCLFLGMSFGPLAAWGQDPFALGVRDTEPLTAQDEQKTFHVPPGFEVQLVATEPEIQKPLNMAFDAKGRMWLTDSQEYPFAAPPDRKGRDTIKILEDTNGDGRADKITTFADGLNIPIGIYPYRDGCIAFSIPYVWFLRDTDGDGTCDTREKLFGPLAYDRDTHGLHNAFRRGFDGWLYACHGFNNRTEVAGADGHKITMNSGNTYRMRLDGSRVEHFTHGQVNPFGMAFDEWGNQFTADCHSKPLTALLRGAYYPSFGAPHDGLGFVSPMMDHLHGSTAIAGVAYVTGENFPKTYRGNLLSGNVMTSRINRNSLVYHGSTIRAKEEMDFLSTDDPWFRPVDLVFGPDGAMYVADFYNRIIGHYEVDLYHPGRDRHRGRIWRIVYTGNDKSTKPAKKIDLATADTKVLIEALGNSNLIVRQLATDQLTDRIGTDAVPELQEVLQTSKSAETKVQALWALYRLKGLGENLLVKATEDPSELVRTHAMKVLAETPKWSQKQAEWAERGLADSSAFVNRAAADAFGQHPDHPAITSLEVVLQQTPQEDDHLRHVIRMAIREQLRRPDAFTALLPRDLPPKEDQELVEIALAVESEASAAFVLDRIASRNLPEELFSRALEHSVRFLPVGQTDLLVKVAREKCADNSEMQFQILTALHAGLERRGIKPTEPVRGWVEEVTKKWLAELPKDSLAWMNTPLASEANPTNPWAVQTRASSDGDKASAFFCSLPQGEQLTGRLRSRSFEIPERLTFYAAGHIGPPNEPVVAKNFIRLLDAKTNAVLKESTPPRNDTAQKIEWDLTEFAGKEGYLEIVDGDTRGAYAWLAVGRFEPNIVPMPALSPRDIEERLITTANLIAQYELRDGMSGLKVLLQTEKLSPRILAALIRAMGTLSDRAEITALALVAEDTVVPDSLRQQIGKAVAGSNDEAIQTAITEAFRQCPARLQTALADALAGDVMGRELVLGLIEKGIAPARMLQNPPLKDRLLSTAKTGEEKQALENRIALLTAFLPTADDAISQLIKTRQAGFQKAQTDIARGHEVFKKHCAACHQVDGAGSVVGPQLDGIGNRGLERLLEDVLDPNRNVDVAFRISTIAMEDGMIHTGLVRRDEGAVRVLVDQKGKEFTIQKNEIAEEKKSNLSLMPANVAEIVPENEFFDLTAFLLSRKTRPAGETPIPNSK